MIREIEILNFYANSPIRLHCIVLEKNERRWPPILEIILVLKGSMQIIYNDDRINLLPDDIIVINPGSVYEAVSDTACAFISLQIDTKQLGIDGKKIFFDCNSANDNNKGKYYNLKHRIAQIVKINSDDAAHNDYLNKSMVFSIMHELSLHFKADKAISANASKKYAERTGRIIDYINEHYREALTLNKLAEIEHLSVPYLSSFFDKYFGVNFTTYYNEIRLMHAVHDLLATDHSIETITLNNGFTDPRSFVTLFKKKYNSIPSIYRKLSPEERQHQNEGIFDVSDFDEESFLQILAQYLPSPNRDTSPDSFRYSDEKNISVEKISMSSSSKTLRHTFKTFTSVGRAKELLLSDVQDMLRSIQKDVGYEYIKFHGLLSDDMLVYTEDETGKPIYSFVFIDKVLDFLLSINLKPLIQFSFMPSTLASVKDKTIFASEFNVSPPKDYQKWKQLIDALMHHLIARYSMRTVKTWLFCAWNEPDTSENMFGFHNDQDFYKLYQITYDCVKSISKSFVFGSPSLMSAYNLSMDWMISFLSWCKENDRTPDFLNIHYYDNDFSQDNVSLHRVAHPAHSRLNRDENAFKKTLRQTKLVMRDLMLNIPIYLTEWNLTVSHRNLLNDTCFKSCYLVKNLLENYDELDSFGYWVLTDLLEETFPSKHMFHGGLGLFTYNGIKKAHYHALALLSRLGDKYITSGNGYFITKSHRKIQIMLYNYEHFNHLFASGETFDMTYTARYTPFSELGKLDVSLELTDLSFKDCTIKEHTINQKFGSSFDQWVTMGALDTDKDDVDFLKSISVPKRNLRKEHIENGVYTVLASLAPLEVRLVEILY